jgi:hypothetical protein
MLSAGYLVVAGALGAILLVTSAEPAGGGEPPGAVELQTPTPTRTTSQPRTSRPPSRTTTTTTSPASAPTGFRRVVTQAGMTTVVPEGWPVGRCASQNGCEQSTDPANANRFLRFGGSPSPPGDLFTVQGNYERQFSQRTGYQRIRFESTSHHGHASVDWEFEWISSGVRRHVRVLYWRAEGDDNLVYASSTADTWDQMLPIYQAMTENSTP